MKILPKIPPPQNNKWYALNGDIADLSSIFQYKGKMTHGGNVSMYQFENDGNYTHIFVENWERYVRKGMIKKVDESTSK